MATVGGNEPAFPRAKTTSIGQDREGQHHLVPPHWLPPDKGRSPGPLSRDHFMGYSHVLRGPW